MTENFERPNWDEYFMLQAELAKLRSNCISRHVGAVIVKNNRQIAMGYNGTPPGVKNCYEGGCERCKSREKNEIKSGTMLDRCLCNHAEANAIMHCAIFGIKTDTTSSVLYTTHNPCLECTKMAITIGIRNIVTTRMYHDSEHDLLNGIGVKITLMHKNKIRYWLDQLGYSIE